MKRAFLDTNLFVYASSDQDPHKRKVAEEVLAATREYAVISSQVCAEFIRAMSKGRDSRRERALIARRAEQMLDVWPQIPIGSSLVLTAVSIWESHAISYWDAQILAAALLAECRVILTEDVHAPIAGIRYVDPFTDGFDLAKDLW